MLLMRYNIYNHRWLPINILYKHLQLKKQKSGHLFGYLHRFDARSEWCVSRRRFLQTVATVQNRTSRLLELLENAKNNQSRLVRLEELNEHLLRYFCCVETNVHFVYRYSIDVNEVNELECLMLIKSASFTSAFKQQCKEGSIC